MKWIEIERPAPVLNTPKFSEVFGGVDGKSIPLDEKKHPHHYEFVALPQMSFPILKQIDDRILEIQSDYSQSPFYIDRRFGKIVSTQPRLIQRTLPNNETILERMERRVGTPYVWGGNWAPGIPEILELYPPAKPLDERTKTLWTFSGLDCSGLLFEATNGATPRNTNQLINIGTPLILKNLRQTIRPLDMIIYLGHVLFARDHNTIIESKSPFGVRICPIEQRFEEISNEKVLVDQWPPEGDPARFFLVRRIA